MSVRTKSRYARTPLADKRMTIQGRVIGRSAGSVLDVDVRGHVVHLRAGYTDGALDPVQMATLDSCCNGDLVVAYVRPWGAVGGGFRTFELLSLDIDIAGLSAAPEVDGPLLWNAADGVETGPNGGKDHGKTEARTTETHEQAEG